MFEALHRENLGKPYGLISSEEYNGHFSVQFKDRIIQVPGHMLAQISITDKNAFQGKSFRDEYELLQTISISHKDDKGNQMWRPWTIAGFLETKILLYRGPNGILTDDDLPEQTEENKVVQEYSFGDPVLLMTTPDSPDGRFIVLEKQEEYGQIRYCCRPLNNLNRGIVWLPQSSFYHSEMWFQELGKTDPLPISIRMPLPNIRMDLNVYPVQHGFLVYEPVEEEEDSEIIQVERNERTNPILIGAAIVGLFYLIND